MAPLENPAAYDGTSIDPIRMSVLSAVLEIRRYREANPRSSLDEARRVLAAGLASRTGHAYPEAIELLVGLPSFRLPDRYDRATALRSLLRDLTIERRPGWARLIPQGRRHLAAYLPPNARQCFEAAHLFDDDPDEEVSEWWYSLSSHFRSMLDLERTLAGRDGERLTLAHEATRLAAVGRPDLAPKSVSLEDNSLGYDVLSYRLDDCGRETALHIEVKASSAGSTRFFLTRNEWKVARSMGNAFVLHLWDLSSQTLRLLSVPDIEAHIPVDRGRGRWQQLEVCLERNA